MLPNFLNIGLVQQTTQYSSSLVILKWISAIHPCRWLFLPLNWLFSTDLLDLVRSFSRKPYPFPCAFYFLNYYHLLLVVIYLSHDMTKDSQHFLCSTSEYNGQIRLGREKATISYHSVEREKNQSMRIKVTFTATNTYRRIHGNY